MSDPRDYRPDLGRTSADVNAVWGWVAAAAFVAVVLLFVFATGNDNRNAANKGINMPPTASAPALQNPHSAPSTTGAGPTSPGPPAPGAPGGAKP